MTGAFSISIRGGNEKNIFSNCRKYAVYLFFIIPLNFFFSASLFSQDSPTVIKPASTLTSIGSVDSPTQKKQVDLSDVFKKYFGRKKQTKLAPDTNTHFVIFPAAGYSIQTGFAAVLAGSTLFYPYKKPPADTKVSTLLTSITYSQYNQFIFPVQTDIWSKGNRYNLNIDWRFMSYPSTTFGLGGKSKLNNGYTINFNYIKLHQSVMKKISHNLFGGIGFYFDSFWDVEEVGVAANNLTDFKKYGFQKKVKAAGPALKLLYDSRDNPVNAGKGLYANIVFRANSTLLGSDNNWNSLLVEIRKYFHLTPTTKNVLVIWSYNWLTIGKSKPPYLLLPSTGWDDFFNTGRGYIQGRFRGKDMIYAEAEYRFGISSNGLVGAVLFANAQSFSAKINKELRLITPGFGAGMRIKLNKLTNTNLCIDYGFGVDGSRGISVNLGEVF